jgi:hypothetical protein
MEHVCADAKPTNAAVRAEIVNARAMTLRGTWTNAAGFRQTVRRYSGCNGRGSDLVRELVIRRDHARVARPRAT